MVSRQKCALVNPDDVGARGSDIRGEEERADVRGAVKRGAAPGESGFGHGVLIANVRFPSRVSFMLHSYRKNDLLER